MRIAVIDIDNKRLYIEDVPLGVLGAYGNTEAYIEGSYTFTGRWEWYYINDVVYIGENGKSIDVEPKNL